jgi:hypothetical protein
MLCERERKRTAVAKTAGRLLCVREKDPQRHKGRGGFRTAGFEINTRRRLIRTAKSLSGILHQNKPARRSLIFRADTSFFVAIRRPTKHDLLVRWRTLIVHQRRLTAARRLGLIMNGLFCPPSTLNLQPQDRGILFGLNMPNIA